MMVERDTMKSDEEEVDSLDVFTENQSEDIFLDSLEPTVLKEKIILDNLVGCSLFEVFFSVIL